MKRLRIGITNSAYGYYGDDSVKKIKECGYDCIDFQGFVNVDTDFFRSAAEEFKTALLEEKRLYDSLGITVSQTHAPWTWPPSNSTDEDIFKWTEAIKKAIYGTALLGCDAIAVHPLLPYMVSPDNPDRVMALNRAFFTELAEFAKQHGVTVCIENMPWPVFPLATVESVCELVNDIGMDNLKVCLDTGHAAVFKKENVSEAVQIIGDKLKILHIHDNMGANDEHLFPGDGIIDWDRFARALKGIGFSGTVSIEVGQKRMNAAGTDREALEKDIVCRAEKIAETAFNQEP